MSEYRYSLDIQKYLDSLRLSEHKSEVFFGLHAFNVGKISTGGSLGAFETKMPKDQSLYQKRVHQREHAMDGSKVGLNNLTTHWNNWAKPRPVTTTTTTATHLSSTFGMAEGAFHIGSERKQKCQSLPKSCYA